jgi:DnaK suppressor protein
MTPDERATLRRHMEQELAALRETIAILEGQVDPVAPDAAVGHLSRLDTMQSQAIAGVSLGNSRRRLLRLESALRRVDDADFGECENCGEPIPAARLLAMPESTLCVRCAEQMQTG